MTEAKRLFYVWLIRKCDGVVWNKIVVVANSKREARAEAIKFKSLWTDVYRIGPATPCK